MLSPVETGLTTYQVLFQIELELVERALIGPEDSRKSEDLMLFRLCLVVG